jgi:hypothetical protein
MPPDVKGRPPVTSREGGPDANSAPITTASVTPGEASLLQLSGERDVALGLRLAAWREGWHARGLADRDAYERGFHDGCMALKRAQHDYCELTELETRRWGPGGRDRFADPRPGDYPGQAAS